MTKYKCYDMSSEYHEGLTVWQEVERLRAECVDLFATRLTLVTVPYSW